MRIPADFAFKKDFEAYLDASFGPEVPHKVADFVHQYETTVAVSERPVEQMIIDLLAGSLTNSPDDPARALVTDKFLPENTAYKKALFDDNDVDVLVYPTDYAFAYPVVTPILNTNDPTFVGGDGPNSFIFAGYSSVANPAIAVPMGVGKAGLPASITFMGRPYEEGEILGFAYAYEQATHLRVPPDLSKL
jgi:amidase